MKDEGLVGFAGARGAGAAFGVVLSGEGGDGAGGWDGGTPARAGALRGATGNAEMSTSEGAPEAKGGFVGAAKLVSPPAGPFHTTRASRRAWRRTADIAAARGPALRSS